MIDPHDWPVWVPFAWIGVILLISIVFRLNRGKSFYPRVPEGAVYRERWGSARSLDSWWKRIGGANNCMIIAVTNDRLTIVPHFPFNLMFLPEIYGLEVTAPLSSVRIENHASGMLKRGVTISVSGPDATRMELRPRNRATFLAALGYRAGQRS